MSKSDLIEEAARLRAEVALLRKEAQRAREEAARTKAELEERMTQIREANEHLVVASIRAQTMTEAAERASQQREEFVAMLAHELRNPLAPIRSAVAVLRRIATAEPMLPWVHDVIGRQVEQMARLLDDLLDVSRITSGKIVLQKRPVLLTEFLERAIETSQPLIDARGQELRIDIPSQPMYVDGDPVRLGQVFSNLLNNAAKYTSEGGAIALSAKRCDDKAVLQITDNGCGIAADALPHIFDLFKQADRSLARAEGGLGIGLTVVRSLVALHGGSVQAHSAGLDRGSEFIVMLPLIQAVARADPGASTELTPKGCSYRIVLIDDNADANDSLKTLLMMVGHEVTTASDGASALALVQTSRPQIVLCDIGLPGMDGYAVIAQLRKLLGDAMPVMFALTGYGQAEDRARALAAGFDQHLVKPVDPEALLQLIATQEERSAAASRRPN